MSNRRAKPTELEGRHLGFGMIAFAICSVLVAAVNLAFNWAGWNPFVGEGLALGPIFFPIIINTLVLQDRVKDFRRFALWCAVMVPACMLVTFVLGLILTMLSSWTEGINGIGLFLSLVSAFAAVTLAVLFVIVAGRLIGPPEWMRGSAEGDGDAAGV